MKNEVLTQTEAVSTPKRKCGIARKLAIAMGTMSAMGAMTATTALASGFGEDVSIDGSADLDAAEMMGKIIGILLTITRFVGIALIVYGIYEIVMSFMQNQPEAKTKGIIMALAGVVMTALKSILGSLGVINT